MGSYLDTIKNQNRLRFDGPIEQDGKHLPLEFLEEIFSPVWHISFDGYTESHWKNVLRHVTSCQTTELSFKNIKAPDILYQIIHIRFERLLHLKLNNLYLVSVEPLVHLRAEFLKVLQFSLNNFNSLKSLRKMNTPHLDKLELYENSLVQASSLTECNFRQLGTIIIFNAKTKTLPECYNWLFKMQSQKIAYFEYYNTQIIRNEPFRQMVRKKYPTCEAKLRFDTL